MLCPDFPCVLVSKIHNILLYIVSSRAIVNVFFRHARSSGAVEMSAACIRLWKPVLPDALRSAASRIRRVHLSDAATEPVKTGELSQSVSGSGSQLRDCYLESGSWSSIETTAHFGRPDCFGRLDDQAISPLHRRPPR